jgi:RNA polymerase sigma-70 factor, ECF subfamily
MRPEPRRDAPPPTTPSRLLLAAIDGPDANVGELLDAYRPFLLAVAEAQLDADLRRKASPSDLVQETIIEAGRDFHRAAFKTDQQVEAWLKTMLMNNLADLRKRYRRAAKRDIRRERSVHDSRVQHLLDHAVQRAYVRSTRDDQRQMVRDRLARALKRLPSQQRTIILWVHMKGLSLNEIAQRVDRSYDATRMYWKRALKRLKQELQADDKDSDVAY